MILSFAAGGFVASANAAVASGGREVRRIEVVSAVGRGWSSAMEEEASLVAEVGMTGVLDLGGGVDIVSKCGCYKYIYIDY